MKFFVTAFVPMTGHASGDAEKGALVFRKCATCHNIDNPENKIGPHLVGLLGRKAGTVETYAKYSDSMKKADDEGVVWDKKNSSAYLAAPKKFLPGNRISFTGLKSADDVAPCWNTSKESERRSFNAP